jgi:hypothetical protein
VNETAIYCPSCMRGSRRPEALACANQVCVLRAAAESNQSLEALNRADVAEQETADG